MWPFSKKTYSEELKGKFLGLKEIKAGDIKFTIKKINPLLDFPSDKIPQIFTDFISRRNIDKDYKPSEKDIEQMHESIIPILEAGIYRPKLSKMGIGKERGKEAGLTARDLFIDNEIAYKLFSEIMSHSLNRFKGLVGLFFSKRIKHWLFMQWPVDMGKVPLM